MKSIQYTIYEIDNRGVTILTHEGGFAGMDDFKVKVNSLHEKTVRVLIDIAVGPAFEGE